MSLPWPSFLQRARLLSRARRALLLGDAGGALETLRDPRLALSDRARLLRARAVEWLAREADRRAARGDHDGSRACVETLRLEDPARARECEAAAHGSNGSRAPDSAPPSAAGSAMERLLREMRSELERAARVLDPRGTERGSAPLGIVSSFPAPSSRADPVRADPVRLDPVRLDPARVDPVRVDPARVDPARVDPARVDPARVDPVRVDPVRVDPVRVDPPRSDPPRSDRTAPGADPSSREDRARVTLGELAAPSGGAHAMTTLRFHLTVDDAGEYLAVAGSMLTLGHLRSTEADLHFLADVESEHARLIACESFHGGPTWAIAACARASVRVNGRACDTANDARTLADGDEIELAQNLRFRYRVPEPSSGSALLELLGGAECEGARRVLLLMPGAIGRVRIGAKKSRHVRVPDLASDLSLELDGATLIVRYAPPIALANVQPPSERALVSADANGSLSLACPPPRPVHLTFQGGESRSIPFGISIGPTERGPREHPGSNAGAPP